LNRAGERQDQRRAADQVELAPAEPPDHGQPEPDDQDREYEPDEPFRQHCERRAHVEEQEPRAAPIRPLGVAEKPIHRQGETEDEQLIRRRAPDVERIADE